MALPLAARLTPEEYLEMERLSDVKHEYWLGEVFAMAGGRENHEIVCWNLAGIFYQLLRGTPCQGFTSNMKVGMSKKRGFAYPDLTIVCGERKFYDDVRDVLMNPSVIFEVLSDSTRDADLSSKLVEYKKLESLRHYVLVEQDKMFVYHLEKTQDDRWVLDTLEKPHEELVLTAVGARIPLADIYREVALPTPAPDAEVSD